MRRLAIKALGSLVLLALALGLAEGLARLALIALGRPLIEQRPPRTEFQPWGVWGLPGGIGKMTSECYSIDYRFNSIGSRDRERSLIGKGRYVFLGDSFAEGFGVNEEARISNRLEALTGHEVLNFGSAGNFGPLQYLILYQKLATRYEHDGLIVGFLPDNDFTDNDPSYWAAPEKKTSWQRHRPYYNVVDAGKLTWQYGVFGTSIPRQNFDKRPNDTLLEKIPVHGLERYFSLAFLVKQVTRGLATKSQSQQNLSISQYFSHDTKEISAVGTVFAELAKAAQNRRKIIIVFARNLDIAAQRESGERASHEVEKLFYDLALQGWEIFDTSQIAEVKALKDLSLGCDEHWNAAVHDAAARAIAPELMR